MRTVFIYYFFNLIFKYNTLNFYRLRCYLICFHSMSWVQNWAWASLAQWVKNAGDTGLSSSHKTGEPSQSLSCPGAENKEGTDSPLGVETICPSIIWLTLHPSPFPNNYLSSPFLSLLPWNIFPLYSQGYKKRVGWGYTVWSWGGSGNPKRNLIFRSIQDFPTTGSILGSFETT